MTPPSYTRLGIRGRGMNQPLQLVNNSSQAVRQKRRSPIHFIVSGAFWMRRGGPPRQRNVIIPVSRFMSFLKLYLHNSIYNS